MRHEKAMGQPFAVLALMQQGAFEFITAKCAVGDLDFRQAFLMKILFCAVFLHDDLLKSKGFYQHYNITVHCKVKRVSENYLKKPA